MSSDNATLLSYYNCSNNDEASLVEPGAHASSDHMTSSGAPDPADKSHTVTISRLAAICDRACENQPSSRTKIA